MAELDGVISIAETSPIDQSQEKVETERTADETEVIAVEKSKALEGSVNGDEAEVNALVGEEDQDLKRKVLEVSSNGDQSESKRQKLDSEEADQLDKNEAQKSHKEQQDPLTENGKHNTEENVSKTSEQEVRNDEITPAESKPSEQELQNDETIPAESKPNEQGLQNDETTPDESKPDDEEFPNDEFTPYEFTKYNDPDMTTTRKIEVPSKRVGVIIGKAGDTIRNLQFNSGAKIQIVKDADADPNSKTRDVELIGTLECINKAEQLIKDVLAEADKGGSAALLAKGSGHTEQVEIQVPIEKVGVVIGKGGQMIKDLQSRSGARIQLVQQQDSEGGDVKERTVRINGNNRQIDAAKNMIRDVISQSGRPQSHHRGSGNRQNHGSGSRGPSSGNNWGSSRSHHQNNNNYNNNNRHQHRGGNSNNNYHSAPQSQNYPQQQNYGNYPPPSMGPGQYGQQQGYGPNSAYQAPPQQMYQAPPAQQYYGQQSQPGFQTGYQGGYQQQQQPYNNNAYGASAQQQYGYGTGAPAQQYGYGPGAPAQQYPQQGGYGQAGQVAPLYNTQAMGTSNMNWSADGYSNTNQAMGQTGQMGQVGFAPQVQPQQGVSVNPAAAVQGQVQPGNVAQWQG